MDNKEQIKQILLDGFIEVENGNELENDTPLISSGILDSISILQLIDTLEKTFEIGFEAHEIDRDKFDSIDLINQLIVDKKQ
ncbi:MAG: phosphopantetheine-binding protein [Vicingaceae bacterium]|nr:phosphopantetheine-binding protein [Vicingaceae bacterium]